MELLSPAGTLESFYAAISNGADAIYLGLDKFSARAYATNFTLENLKPLVDFAHLRNVRIFVTINTILYDNELSEAFNAIDQLAKMNVDAIIVQDLAILDYITRKYKSLEAHASTQMGVDDIEGTKLLKDLGVTRVVYARETPIEVLKNIKKSVNIEIETFIHGALCVSYSGNCLMSSLIGDRSGNRGRCAGCCRQVYSLVDLTHQKTIKTGYLLSMKDLNTSNNIENMRFIDSLKIEGRMKEPNYVASVTKFYRNLIDKVDQNKEDINKVFNRTYTQGFLFNATSEDITNIERPNNYGYEIGKIVKINQNKIWIKLFRTLNKGDQIRIESKNIFKEISIPITKMFDADFKETSSNNKVAILYTNENVFVGAKVYKTKDNDFVKKANESIKETGYRKIPLQMEFSASLNNGILLKISYIKHNIFIKSQFLPQKAIKNGTNEDIIINQLSKLNDTPYFLNDINVILDNDLFIPLKEINELRRKGIEELNKARLNKKVLYYNKEKRNPVPYTFKSPEISVRVRTLKQYELVKSLGIEEIYFENVISRNNEIYKNLTGTVLVQGLGGLNKYKNTNEVVVDSTFNVINAPSVALLSSLGVKRVTLSNEISFNYINALIDNYKNEYHTDPNLELIVYGKTPLMHSKYCPLRRLDMCGECKKRRFALKDKFQLFPLYFNNDCTLDLLNSKTLNIIDDLEKVDGISYYRVEIIDETDEEIRKIITSLKEKISGKTTKIFNKEKETRGHFIKNPL